jgi:biotin-(acetyl-CoA carboxylase) ligase
MVSLRLAAGAAATALALVLPAAAHAAPAVVSDDCAKAMAVAEKTQKDYESWLKWYNDIIAQGGHPGIAERQALADAKADRDRTASQAQRICGP